MVGRQKLNIFRIQSHFLRPKIDLIFPNTIFLYEHQISRATFINNNFDFDQYQKSLFSKNGPNFRRLAILSVVTSGF